MDFEQPTHQDPTDARLPWRVLIFMPLLFAAIILAYGIHQLFDDPLSLFSTDDAMRMVQVLDLKDGAGWYDLTQKRLNPPAGVGMHWSRLPDLPLLAALTIGEPILGRGAAVHVTAILIPPLLGLLFFAAFVWAAAPMVERELLPVAGLVCLALIVSQTLFAPGRVDHHGWQLILAMIGVGAVVRVALALPATGPLVGAGLAGALGLWIGAEAIPAIALVSTALTLCWVARGHRAGSHLVLYGASVAGGVLIIFPLALAPANWSLQGCDAFSLVSLGLAGVTLVFGMGVVTLEQRFARMGRLTRALAAFVLGGALIAALLLLFPECRSGPYGSLSPEVKQLVRHTIESQPMLSALGARPTLAVLLLTVPLVSLVLTIWRVRVVDASERLLWLCLLIFVGGGIALQFWQLRASPLANAFAGIPLCWWAARWSGYANGINSLLIRVFVRAAPILAILGLPILMFGVVKATTEPSGALQPHECQLTPLLSVLKTAAFKDSGPLLIATHINIGPALLLETPHQILAAPYHRNADGLQAIGLIFGDDEQRAHQTVNARDVDLVYVCGGKLSFMDGSDAGSKANKPSFYAQLESGEAPAWLTEILLPMAKKGERLYRVTAP